MVQGGSGLSLSPETAEGLRIAGNFIGQELQRHETAQANVFSLLDHSHTTAAELLDDAVVRDGLADHGKKSVPCETILYYYR